MSQNIVGKGPDNALLQRLENLERAVAELKSAQRVSGDDIVTGKISSSDGLTYFDLATNKRIVINDGTVNRMLLGKDNGGLVRMKLSQATYDVLTATDDHLVWSADFNSFKIAAVLTGTIATGGVAVSYGLTLTHSLGYKPMAFGSVIASYDGKIRPLPAAFFSMGSTYEEIGAFTQIEGVSNTDVTITLNILNLAGLSGFGANAQTMSYKVYLVRETIT